MIFERFYDRDLAHASFLVACSRTGQAVIVDPRRDLQIYFDRAAERGLSIDAVAETHIHADYLSGGRELAAATSARLIVSAEGGPDWQVHGVDSLQVTRLQDGERFAVGDLQLEAIHTPGHTPEHLTFGVFEPGHTQMTLALTGDFLFVGALGRPDLLDTTGIAKDTREDSARTLFDTLVSFRERVPAHAPLWPGHGAGSACGKALGELPCTTLGAELHREPWGTWLDTSDRESFVSWLLSDQPDSPTYFHRMKVWNRDGFPQRSSSLRPNRLTPTAFVDLLESGALPVDLRTREEFCGGHFPKALSLPVTAKLATWTAWILSEPTDLVLLADSSEDADAAAAALSRVGHDKIQGYLPVADLPPQGPITLEAVSPADAQKLLSEWTPVDVRTGTEYQRGHVPHALHAPIARFQEVYEDLPRDTPLLVYCGSGARATVAASVLQAEGFGPIKVVQGSMSRSFEGTD